jgi:hypothetical protein
MAMRALLGSVMILIVAGKGAIIGPTDKQLLEK